MQNAECRGLIRLVLHSAFCILHSALAVGCTWDQFDPFKPPVPPPPVESFVLRNGALVAEPRPKDKSAEADLAGAREYFRREDYAKAERLYHRLANKKDKIAVSMVQEALYYEAECLRLQGKLPKAADVYTKLLHDYTINPYKDLATRHIYEIALFWLQDTWEEIQEKKERREGKRWMVWPRFLSFDKRKPFIDREGRAVERLRDVSMYESKGGVFADKALYLCGYVNWFNEDFSDADQDFSRLYKDFQDSPFAPYAIELAIKAKLMSTGGEVYDGRKVADARKLVHEALRMPHLSRERKEDLMKLLGSINAHQAEKDFQMGEFYRRTGHPGSAYFYYEIVRRRYPGTETADRAVQRMWEIRAKLAKEQQDKLGAPPESDGRPTELLPPPRRVSGGPVPMMPPPDGSETAPMPRKVPTPETAPPPRRLPAGLGGN